MAYCSGEDVVMFRAGTFKVGATEYVVQVMRYQDKAAGVVVVQKSNNPEKPDATYVVKRLNQGVLEQAMPLFEACRQYMMTNPTVNQKPKNLEEQIKSLQAQLAKAQKAANQ